VSKHGTRRLQTDYLERRSRRPEYSRHCFITKVSGKVITRLLHESFRPRYGKRRGGEIRLFGVTTATIYVWGDVAGMSDYVFVWLPLPVRYQTFESFHVHHQKVIRTIVCFCKQLPVAFHVAGYFFLPKCCSFYFETRLHKFIAMDGRHISQHAQLLLFKYPNDSPAIYIIHINYFLYAVQNFSFYNPLLPSLPLEIPLLGFFCAKRSSELLLSFNCIFHLTPAIMPPI
jgi:hypothetical protein